MNSELGREVRSNWYGGFGERVLDVEMDEWSFFGCSSRFCGKLLVLVGENV